ncbi:SMC-Scp complex subunit ScpB [Micromonospora humi]|uniref:Segregation and condensation protein B n=1 Tax=Micromonospora humi TaxID=745366 RepID=A0A1C5K3G7_9ACTN|nr:SMC-Scp complex subunit ScpB [Micromonospora humi]SCG77337.1 segregation and condensation protein B [Micromonospora humi]
MSDEERRDSLADQAAAWIPPWARPTPPEPTPSDEAPPRPDEAPPAAARPEPDTVDTYRSPERADLDSSADLGSDGPPEGPFPSKISSPGETSGEAPGGGDGGDVGAPGRESAADDGGSAGGVPQKRGRRRAAPEPAPAPVLDDAELRGALEAILLVVDQPVSELVLAEVLEQAPERVGAMLDDIAAGYTAAGHGFELRRAAGGWRLYTRPEYAGHVERFVLDGQSVRLTQAALETLAVVAYRQPVTRSRISAIRGVNCDGVLRTLVGRGLVEECGTEADSGAFLYRTTTLFLEKLGLNSVDDLPPLAPFLPDDVEELADATR